MAVVDAFGLPNEIIQTISEICGRFPKVNAIKIYGSRAVGTHKPFSDIDLAVFAPDMNAQEFSELWLLLDSLPLVFKLDVVHWEALENEALKQNIMLAGKSVAFRS